MYHFQVAYNDLNPKAGTGEHLTPEEENRGLLRLSTEYKLPVTACVYVGVGELMLVTAMLALGSTDVAGDCQHVWTTPQEPRLKPRQL